MLLPKFQYHEPSTIDEACQIMAEFKEKACPLAGGTDLLVKMKNKIISPENVVSLGRIEKLTDVDHSGDRLKIGACRTVAQIAQSERIRDGFNALKIGAESLGSPLIRNLATIGGNILTARPAADLPPPLMAYGARVVLRKSSGERSVSLDDFFRGPGLTVLFPDEILTEIVMEKPPPNSGAGYIKLGLRKAQEISLVNVAVFVSLDGQGNTIKTARVVLGAVAPVPMRAPSAEHVLTGEKPGESLFVKAAEAAAGESKPIDDFRGSALYRRDMVKVLTLRALNMAYKEAHG